MDEFRQKAEALVAQMTVEEMASQLRYDAPAVGRLGIPGYNWWNEGLHGVARAGTATVFPQAIGLAAMFDAEFLQEIADVVATEGRAKYNEQSAQGDVDIYKGLTFWSPNINIFRDPRWGRGHETYGEDPYLTSQLGVAFIKGLQGDGTYMKTAACAKHFAVHSGPEAERHSFDAVVSEKDLEETYLPAFEAAVKEGRVEAVMGAYNRVNGEPCCGSETLLKKTLREKWGFRGHVVSDCWAISDFHMRHMVTKTAEESAALALKNGCDLNCGITYLHLLMALRDGLVTEEEIKEAAVRLFTTRMKLGMFDADCEYNQIPYEKNDCAEHREICLAAARRSAVLLKNDGILPLAQGSLRTVGVIGPTADLRTVLEGNYNGRPSEYVTNLEGIRRAAGGGIRILYAEGCHLYQDRVQPLAWPDDRLSEAVAVAKHSDVVVLCVGLDATLEGEEGDTGNSFASGDKKDLLLPEPQRKLMEAVCAVGKPVILVLNSGSAIDVSFAQENCNAVLECWYSGAFGGLALAEILFGKVNPSGKLPVTFYYDKNLPDFRDYSMKGRTYRYLAEKPLYPFGYGLSYTSFSYDALSLRVEVGEDGRPMVKGSVKVANTGSMDGEETVQIYLDRKPQEKAEEGLIPENQPHYSLCWFGRVSLAAGEEAEVEFTITPLSLEAVREDGSRKIYPGSYAVYAGGSQPDARSAELLGGEGWCRKEVCL